LLVGGKVTLLDATTVVLARTDARAVQDGQGGVLTADGWIYQQSPASVSYAILDGQGRLQTKTPSLVRMPGRGVFVGLCGAAKSLRGEHRSGGPDVPTLKAAGGLSAGGLPNHGDGRAPRIAEMITHAGRAAIAAKIATMIPTTREATNHFNIKWIITEIDMSKSTTTTRTAL
jgi:hypothetical protein